MSGRNYSSEILISVKPESVYNAITKDIDKWWTELSNQALQVGDRLIVRFEKTTSWVMTVSEALPNRSLIWTVTEANHDLEDITKKDEWQGTTIKWEIVKNETGSRVTLTHEGLVPALNIIFLVVWGNWIYEYTIS
jgi:uncharacterized protein YndB with AHSA1/START domain